MCVFKRVEHNEDCDTARIFTVLFICFVDASKAFNSFTDPKNMFILFSGKLLLLFMLGKH